MEPDAKLDEYRAARAGNPEGGTSDGNRRPPGVLQTPSEGGQLGAPADPIRAGAVPPCETYLRLLRDLRLLVVVGRPDISKGPAA